MSRNEKLLRSLLLPGYLVAVYLFLTAIGPEKVVGANPMASTIAPLLVLAGALNFMTGNAAWKQCFVNIQLFVVGCCLPPTFAVFYLNCRLYHAGLPFSIPPLCALAYIFVLLLLLGRAQRRNG